MTRSVDAPPPADGPTLPYAQGSTAGLDPVHGAEPGVMPASLPRGSIDWQVLVLALPVLGEQFFGFLVGFVDQVLAGHLSKEANSAVGSAVYVSWLLSALFTLVGSGAGALVARLMGAGDRRLANRVANQAVLMGCVAGIATTCVALCVAPLIASAYMRTPIAEAACRAFLRVDALGYALLVFAAIGGGVLRASGDTRSPMVVMILVNLVNLGAGLTFVLGLHWGHIGIALATLTARCCGGVLMLIVLASGWRQLRLRRAELRPDPVLITRMLRIGLPAAADGFVMACAQAVFVYIVTHTATGDAATVNTAAHMIAMRLEGLSYLPAMAWAVASSTLVGQYLGASMPEHATRAGHRAALQGCVLCTLVGTSFVLFADTYFAALTTDPAVRAVGAHAFRYLGFVEPILGAGLIYQGTLRGAGDTRWPVLFSLIGGALLRCPLAYLCGVVLGWGLLGAWLGMWADNVAKCTLCAARYIHGGWKRVRV
jgi:putative MATE family efflux protein